MKNGLPETYREITALKHAHIIEKYVTITDPQLIPEIFHFIMESPVNKVTLNRSFLTFTNYYGEIVKVMPIIPRIPVDYLSITRDISNIRTPGSGSKSIFSSISSNNNNNNNNNGYSVFYIPIMSLK